MKSPNIRHLTIKAGAGAYIMTGNDVEMRAFSPMPPDHAMFATIGRIAGASGHLEHVLDSIIWMLNGQNPLDGYQATNKLLGPKSKFKKIHSLAIVRRISQPILDQINNLDAKIRELTVIRNRIFHDAWFVQKNDGTATQFQKPNDTGSKFGFGQESVVKMETCFEGFQSVSAQVRSLSNQIQTELSAQH